MKNQYKKIFQWVLLGVWLVIVVPVFSQDADGKIGVAPYRLSFQAGSDIVKLPYYRNFSLGSNASTVRHAVIVVHGINRNAGDYYNTILATAFRAQSLNTAHFIMAPQFLIESDMSENNLGAEVMFWKSSGWPVGDLSESTPAFPSPARFSSFAIMDSIVIRLAQKYTLLDTIVVVGHSAGGQFVQRYAAGSPLDSMMLTDYGVAVRYIPANPSSFVYLNNERRITDTVDQFAVPSAFQIAVCPDYNKYKYGLDELNAYMQLSGVDQIRHQYRRKEIIHMHGENDDDPNHSTLDRDCPAMLQGMHRLERGIIFFNFLKHFYGASIEDRHRFVIVPNAAHDNVAMFNSNCGAKYIFNYGACDSVSGIEPGVASRQIMNFRVYPNYPNPFNPGTTIEFDLPNPSVVTVRIYDVSGRLVRLLASGQAHPAGHQQIYWDGNNADGNPVSSGNYFYEVQANGVREIRRMILLK